MKKPLLSVIIPVYNASETIATIVGRVLGQDFPDFELILVNDGSKDNSLEVLQRFAQQDARVIVLTQKNAGASAARNAGIKKSRGKFIMLLDADDDIEPKMIKTMVASIQKNNSDLVVCGIKFRKTKNNKTILETDIDISVVPKIKKNEAFATYITRLLGNDGRLYNPCNKIFRSDIIKKRNIQYIVGLAFGEDLTFNLHYLKHATTIHFVYEPLYVYNMDTANSTFSKTSLIYENRQKNFAELLDFVSPHSDEETLDLIGWIKHYWFCSYGLSVCSSSLTFGQRLKKLKHSIAVEKLIPAKNSKNIGKNKYRIEIILKYASKNTFILYLFMRSFSFFKNNRALSKSWSRIARKI